MKNCLQFLLVCLSILATSSAGATIVYTDFNPDVKATSLSQNDPAFQFDIDGGGVDFGIGADFQSGSFYDGKILNITADVTFATFSTGADAAKNVGFGTTIDASTLWTNRPAGYSHFTRANGNGMWVDDQDGYIGVKLTVGSNVYYGWIRVYLQTGSSGGFIVKDFAYENTPGQAITAGATPPVPINYTFTGSGNWTNASKWTPSYPGTSIAAGDMVTIAGTCTMDASVTSASPITVNAGASFTVNSTLTIGSTFTNNGSFTVNNGKTVNIQSGGTFTHDGTNASISGPMNNSGSFVVSAGKSISFSANGTFTHDGTNASIAGTFALTGNCTVNAGKTMTIETGGTLSYDGGNTSSINIWGSLTNNGTYSVIGAFASVFVNPGGTFTHDGTSAIFTGTLTNAGTLNINAGKTLTVNGSFIQDGTSASISGSLVTSPIGGGITISAGKTLTINSGGSLIENGGSSLISINGTLINNGDLTLTATASSNSFFINSGGTFTHNGTSATISRQITNQGSFNISSGSTLTVNSNGQINSSGGTFTIAGTLNNSGGCQFLGSTLTISSGGILNHIGTTLGLGAGSISNGGTLTQNGTTANISAAFTNNGMLTVNAGKTLNVSFGGTFIQNSATATIYGTLADANGIATTINAGQTLTIANGGSYTHTGSTLTISGTLAVNSGGAFTQNANNPMNVAGTILNDGSVTVSGGRTLNVSSGGTFTNNGMVTNSGSFSNSGILNGTGSFTGGNISNSSGGTIAPGGTPGCLGFSGINSSSGSTFSIEINGINAACTDYDKITASGSVSLNGTLSLSVGYSPTIGDVLTIIEAGSISGTFSAVSPTLSGWTVLYNNPINGRVSLRYDGPPPPAPSNDACAGATPITVSATGSCSTVSGTTVSANLSKAFSCSFGGEAYLDVWYSFTAPASGKVTFTSGISSPFASIYTDCNASSTVAAGCMRGSGTVSGLTGGATYYLQVLTPSSSGMVFDFCLEESGAAPANNSCAAAIPVELGNTITVNSLYALTNTPIPCAPLPTLNAPDLWYTFTAPAGGTLGYSMGGGTNVMTVYSGTCSLLGMISCATPLGQPAPSGLTPGDTYYAQISSLGATTNGTFAITAPNDYTFTGAVNSSFSNPSNWLSGLVPSASNNLTIPNGETCNLDMNFTPTGTITVQSGGMLNIQSGIILNISNGTLANNGTIGGEGTIQGNFTNNTTVAPGSSPGCLAIAGNFSNTASGTLSMEINGTTPCTQYDQLNVTGVATLAGTVNVTWGFTPTPGTFTLMTFGSRSGTFTTVNIPPVAGLSFTYSHTSTTFTITAESALPVELVSFQANKKDANVQLEWQTASELNNQGFDVQRSADASHWEKLAFVPGHGTTLEAQSYTHVDQSPRPGTNYYRLRQVDFDGNFEYSPTVSVQIGGKGSVRLFPNPASSEATLQVDTDFEGNAMLTFFDLAGKQLKTQPLYLTGSHQPIKLDLADLPGKGMYLLVVKAGSQNWHLRFLLN